jgi:hypothetical protein
MTVKHAVCFKALSQHSSKDRPAEENHEIFVSGSPVCGARIKTDLLKT